MNIAFVHQPIEPGVVPPSDSVAIWAHEASRRLAAKHHVVAYARSEGFRSRVKTHAGVRWRFVPVKPDHLLERAFLRNPFQRGPNCPRFASATHYLGYISRIAFDLRRLDAPVVQLFNFSQFVPVVRALNPRARIVLRMSCEWLTQLDPALIAPRLEKVDLIIGCSDYITERIQRAFPAAAGRCVTVYNGRDVDALAPDADHPAANASRTRRILFVGRVSPEKGVHVLLEAFAKVVAQYPNVQLEIVGSHRQLAYDYLVGFEGVPERVAALARFYTGDSRLAYFEKLQVRMRELGLADRVQFAGAIQHAELVHRYHRADILAFPSVWGEPAGNPPIEAMAAGVPVVSTHTGGTVEYVSHGTTGLLVAPEDPEALADAILRLLENEDLRKHMGAAGRQRAVEMFSYEALVATLQTHYQKLADSESHLLRGQSATHFDG